MARVAARRPGWTAFFVELTFPSGGKYPLKVTSGVRVVPDTLPYPAPPRKPTPPPAREPKIETREDEHDSWNGNAVQMPLGGAAIERVEIRRRTPERVASMVAWSRGGAVGCATESKLTRASRIVAARKESVRRWLNVRTDCSSPVQQCAVALDWTRIRSECRPVPEQREYRPLSA